MTVPARRPDVPSDDAGPPSLHHAAAPTLLVPFGAFVAAPPDPYTQLRYLLVALVAAAALTGWLVYDGWDRLGFRTTPYSLRVLFVSWLVLGGLGVALTPPPDGSAVRTAAAVLVSTLAAAGATWLAYRDGVGRLRRALTG
jgi:uncharacterized membrane protein YccC